MGSHIVGPMGQSHNDPSVTNNIDFVQCLSDLFHDTLSAINDNEDVLWKLGGENGFVNTICELQEIEGCDSRGSLILEQYMEYRKSEKLASQINAQNQKLLDPLGVELYLREICALMQLKARYTNSLVSQIDAMDDLN